VCAYTNRHQVFLTHTRSSKVRGCRVVRIEHARSGNVVFVACVYILLAGPSHALYDDFKSMMHMHEFIVP